VDLLAVSPDGKTMPFDILGDLYTTQSPGKAAYLAVVDGTSSRGIRS
jgi:hypothetical protein